MKLGNLLLVVTLATAGLLGSSKTYAQAFQSGDIIMGDYYWYHSDGTFVGNLSYGLCGSGCFVGPGPFDLQGNHYETWDTQPTQQIYVQKYDANGNFVKTVRPPGQYPEGGGPLGLDAKGDIFLDYWWYTTQYFYELVKYDKNGKVLLGWYTDPSLTNFDLSRDQKTMFMAGSHIGVATLNLGSRVVKSLACGSRGVRLLGDGSYLASDGGSNVMHCTATGKLIQTYPIAAAAGDILVYIALNPDGQSFLVDAYYSGNIYKVDLSTGTVTTLIPGGGNQPLEVYGMVHVGECPLLPSTFTVGFPSQKVGTPSLPKTDMLTNFGASSVPIGSVTESGANAGDFAMTETCSNATLAAGKKCSITLTFTPAATGKRTATLQVPHSAGSPICTPLTIAVSGTGTP